MSEKNNKVTENEFENNASRFLNVLASTNVIEKVCTGMVEIIDKVMDVKMEQENSKYKEENKKLKKKLKKKEGKNKKKSKKKSKNKKYRWY